LEPEETFPSGVFYIPGEGVSASLGVFIFPPWEIENLVKAIRESTLQLFLASIPPLHEFCLIKSLSVEPVKNLDFR
jgi:hypothetical protein